MTISSTTRIAGPFTGNGTASAFPFTFKVFAATDLDVIKLTVSTGTESTLVLTTDYTVSLNGDQNSNPGGTVTLTAGALASGFTLTITSDIANLQPTDLTNQGGFYPEVITDSLDRATIQIQQIADIGDRTLKIPISDGTLNMELPTKTERANSFLSFDANGLPSVVTAGSSGAPATITRQVFSGTGSQTVFTLASDPGALGNSAQVYIGGVYQQRSTYTIAGTTLTFSQAPVAGTDNIEFVNFLTSNIGSTSADLVTYTPSGTGAVARSAASKFGETVSVKDFGAVGDGVADDTAAIQAAITAAANKALYFPAGTYVATALTVSSPCRLFGDGILKKTTAANAAFLTISSSDVVIDGLEFRGASFDATPTNVVRNDRAIRASGTNSLSPIRRLRFTNLKINGFAGVAIDVRFAENVQVNECQIQYCGYAGVSFLSVIGGLVTGNQVRFIDATTVNTSIDNPFCISFSRNPGQTLTDSAPCQECIMANNVVSDCRTWTGLDIHGSVKCQIVNNVVARCVNGIVIQYDGSSDPYPKSPEDIIVSGNIVIGRTVLAENKLGICSLGLSAQFNSNVVIENNLVIGCGNTAESNGAILLSYTRRGIVRNNSVYKAIRTGIGMINQCDRCIVEGNVVDGVYGPIPGFSSFWIIVDNNPTPGTKCVVARNRLINTTGSDDYKVIFGIGYTHAGTTDVVFSRNRIDVTNAVKGYTPADTVRRLIDQIGSGVTPNFYTDLKWELETESCAPFTHTATGGAPREATASQISNFRRTPATGFTTASTIARARVSYRSTNTTYQIAVRPNEGNAYTVGVYTVDGTNITAATSIPDIYITIEGIYWED
jgi:hypothetical protein